MTEDGPVRVVPMEHRDLPVFEVLDEALLGTDTGVVVIRPSQWNGDYEVVVHVVGGEVSRADRPAEVIYGPGGGVLGELWWLGGEHHRLDGPAETRWDEDSGKVFLQRWYSKGLISRIEGPAEIVHDSGRTFGQWYFNGDELDGGRDELLHRLTRLPAADLRAAVTDSVLGHVLDRGVPLEAVLAGIAAGVTTAEGVIALHEGSPPEWVLAFEAGSDPFAVTS